MKEAGQALMQLSAQVLKPALRAQLNYEGQLEEVGLTLADAMAMFGSKYLSVLPTPQDRHAFLDQVLREYVFASVILTGDEPLASALCSSCFCPLAFSPFAFCPFAFSFCLLLLALRACRVTGDEPLADLTSV